MSFLDRCLKAVKTVKELQDTITSLEQIAQPLQARSSSVARTDFPQLFARQFPEYEIRRNLTVAQLVPGFSAGSAWYCCCGSKNEQLYCSECGKKRPPRAAQTDYASIPYVLYRDDQPKLAVMLIPSAAWNSSEVVSTMAACKSAGIPCQRYFEEFSNREDYVTSRIRQAL